MAIDISKNRNGGFMLASLSLIFIVGLAMGAICQKLKLPRIIGILVTGIVLGPYVLDLLDPSILSISAELRKMALIIILLKAGLSLNLADLKRVGRPAVLMCFVPACFEIIGMVLLAPKFLGVSVADAAIMGAVVGAVSPAVIVPKMLKITEEGYGKDKSIPQLILAGASVDDVFVIVMFYAFLSLSQTGEVSAMSFVSIPASILLGAAAGLLFGFACGQVFKRFHIRDTVKIIVLLSISLLFVAFEDTFQNKVPFSALIGVMCIGIAVQKVKPELSPRLSQRYNKLWVAAEIILFVLVGASVDLGYAMRFGLRAILLIFAVLLFRVTGVFVCLIKTKLSRMEKLFCMLAYLPKATVQAAIGGIPLSMGLSCGDAVLSVAVLAIIITAPLGAFLIDLTYKKLLNKDMQ